ncbi:MAG TPA: hypothetical protein PLF65_04575 [Desulfobacter postgatei]|jgi:hypothetical protein|uniref:hypothetical protein n=1 Tax=Desulfobacter sp. TaxID=2294 RepID=UPI001B400539|nr:hypothetical protein [Desulfobacter sp.]MBP9598141.1 hypothetical protein [Desulfobacter sp.]HRF90053.1 hypothetical protein [Desulfobacter postgatei]
MMIKTEHIYNMLKTWITETTGNTQITPELAPEERGEHAFVSVYLKEITNSVTTGARPVNNTVQLVLAYLITVISDDIHLINNTIATLTVAALGHEAIEVDQKGLLPWEWQAMNLTPKPSLLIKIPLNCEKEKKAPVLVEKPHVLKSNIMK